MKSVLYILLTVLAFTSCTTKRSEDIVRDDLTRHYNAFHVKGSFVLYDPQLDQYTFCNKSQFNKAYSPASTFKICNSLIGLETGVITDENFVIPWDSVVRHNATWNTDHTLKSAFKNSTVWYYQELARRVGGEKMKFWLDLVKYGNADTSGGIDYFWLGGGLRITPEEQIRFLQKLYENKLPFSQRSMNIVKKIMVASDTSDYVLSAKTGWAGTDTLDVGWYVGFLETRGNVYYFANCIQSSDPHNPDFARARIDITYRIFEDLKLISSTR